jgi:signal transduction histidine kinase
VVLIRVSDKGRGYDPERVVTGPHRGLGLISIRERLSFIGGTVDIRTSPGGGTQGLLTVPLTVNLVAATDAGKP